MHEAYATLLLLASEAHYAYERNAPLGLRAFTLSHTIVFRILL